MVDLSDNATENFFGNRFTYNIDRCDPKTGKTWEKVAGLNNVVTGNRAYEELIHHTSKYQLVQFRQGAGTLRQTLGLDGYEKPTEMQNLERSQHEEKR